MSAYDDWVTVYRPQLPSAESIVPYIRRADAARFYANRGPLVRELEDRLAEAIGQSPRGGADHLDRDLGDRGRDSCHRRPGNA